MKAIRLRTEYMKNPIGIDIARPRLFWNCEGGVIQTAYQIIAVCDGKTVWDSGKVQSSQMTRIPFGGELTSRMKIDWRVQLWDEHGQPGEESTASFEMGLLDPSDWYAKWITGNYKVEKKRRYPVDCFRKNFYARSIVKARLYATACGLYEGCLNGQRIGNFVLAPGHTDYRKRVQYQTYDVTGLIRDGENELTFQLADGWYRGSCGAWGLKNQYGSQTKLLVQLELTDTDGKTITVCSDGNWQWSDDGPIRFADNKDGEVYDANYAPSYQGHAQVTAHNVVPTASNNVAVIEHEQFKPALITTPSGKKILDFGQNIAGYLSFSLSAGQNQTIKLRFGEMLDGQGEFTQENIQCVSKKFRTPLQEVVYTCKEGQNNYKTRFAIFGFQYVLVETSVPFRPEDFTAIAVYSDLETTARFDSSNVLLNKFVENTLWSTKNNSADVPTDCPTRERHGWTGDSQLFCVSANYLMDYFPFARKHIRDLTDWQRKDGAFPQIAPAGGVDFYMGTMNGSVGWADAGVLIPHRLWKMYGDREILEENYDAMARYARFMAKRCGRLGLFAKPLGLKGRAKKYAVNAGQSFGEWAEPADVWPNRWTDAVAPHPEVSTAYTAYIMEIMSEVAEELGKDSDLPFYREYQYGCTEAYQELTDTKGFSLETDRQARLVRPLYFGLLNDTQRDFAQKRLLKAMENYGWRVGTGFLSTPLILYVLGDIDIEAAYHLLENEEMPGWLFMPKSGATTVWESWEGTSAQGGIASLDHYSKGACLEWVFRVMCGIQPDGENHFLIVPRPGGHFTHANFTYQSIYGQVSVCWEKNGDQYHYHVSIPANTTAELHLPSRDPVILAAGEYTYRH